MYGSVLGGLGGVGGVGVGVQDINQQFYHFVKPDDNSQSVLRSHKQIPEIFLTRLLSTKVIIFYQFLGTLYTL